MDGSGLVVSGAQVVQARRGRASDCGAAAQKRWGRARAAAQWRASGAAAAWSGEQAARERRRHGVRAWVQAAVLRGGRETGVRLTRGPAEGLSENITGGPANPKHRKVRWFGEKTVGVNTGVMLTRSEREENRGQKGTGRTVTVASEHPMGVGATAGVRSRGYARAIYSTQ